MPSKPHRRPTNKLHKAPTHREITCPCGPKLGVSKEVSPDLGTKEVNQLKVQVIQECPRCQLFDAIVDDSQTEDSLILKGWRPWFEQFGHDDVSGLKSAIALLLQFSDEVKSIGAVASFQEAQQKASQATRGAEAQTERLTQAIMYYSALADALNKIAQTTGFTGNTKDHMQVWSSVMAWSAENPESFGPDLSASGEEDEEPFPGVTPNEGEVDTGPEVDPDGTSTEAQPTQGDELELHDDIPVAVDDNGDATGDVEDSGGTDLEGLRVTSVYHSGYVHGVEYRMNNPIHVDVNPNTTNETGSACWGSFGVLTIGSNGRYTYTVSDAKLQDAQAYGINVVDIFTYVLDFNGETQEANIQITIEGLEPPAVDTTPRDEPPTAEDADPMDVEYYKSFTGKGTSLRGDTSSSLYLAMQLALAYGIDKEKTNT